MHPQPCSSLQWREQYNTYIYTSGATRFNTPLPWQEFTGQADVPPLPLPFHQPPGPIPSVVQASEPVQFYGRLVDENVMKIIVDETNRCLYMHSMYANMYSICAHACISEHGSVGTV